MLRNILTATFLSLGLSATQAPADEMTDARVKELIVETLRENPELVLEALRTLDQRRAEADAAKADEVLQTERANLDSDPNAPVLGNPDGDVTIVEFFDYNCPYCRKAMPELTALLEADKNIRLVLREWPILGEGSDFAARAALAARSQGKYAEMHNALFVMRGKADAEGVLRTAKDLGLDIDRLKADMKAPEVEEHIATSKRLTAALGFNGTPSFVIGDALIPGFAEQATLAEAVDAARATK